MEGFPLGYEVMNGNTADCTTLEQMRQTGVQYLVGTPKGRLSKLEAELADKEWQHVREGVDVERLEREGEVYVLALSRKRVGKERLRQTLRRGNCSGPYGPRLGRTGMKGFPRRASRRKPLSSSAQAS